ncbi:hypothetical protein NU195Hw_g2327t1 [Hortaea werneckii]
MSRERPDLPGQSKPAGLPSEHSTKSFWHTEPSALLLGHRSTRQLPKHADVVIVGSGITGTAIAHHLLSKSQPSANGEKRDLDVVMLEAREACWGATGRNGGHCQPLLFETPHDPTIGQFELANFHALQSLIKDDEIDCEFHAQPGVRAIYSDHHLKEAEEVLSIMTTTAPELRLMMRLVTDSGQLEKYRIPTAKGAVVTEIAARLWPYKFVTHILERLLTSTSDIAGSFNLQTLTPTTGISRESSDSASSQWTVRTERGDISARHVILATNGYTSHLLPSFSDLIVPCRGQMSALHPLDSVKGDRRLKTSLGFLGDGLDDYLIQRPNDRGGHMMFGGGRQHGPSIGVTDDSILDHKTAKYLRRRLVEALGLPEGQADMKAAETEFKAANEWTGIMGFSRDNHPFIGPVPATHGPIQYGPTDGLYMAAGFTGHGMPNTWLGGASVALMVREALDEEKPKKTSSDQVFQSAKEIYGLPEAYWLTEERLKRAMSGLSVEEQEWAEMDKAAVSST